MPSYHVEKSITIHAPAEKVIACITNFEDWPIWSPWLLIEPTAQLVYHGTPSRTGHGYEWNGKAIGAGKMRLANLSESQIDMNLEFLKPFKSKADVKFDVDDKADRTIVTWHMFGHMPFFLFFMTKMMKAWIGMDYDRGLKMLKEYLETGRINSNSEYCGIVEMPGFEYVGIKERCTMAEVGESMQKTMPRSFKLVKESGLCQTGQPGALYNKTDIKNQQFDYTAFHPVDQKATIPNAVCGSFSSCKAIKVIHTGSYQHLGNAWAMAMTYQRTEKKKPLKSQPPLEIYVDDPTCTPEAELKTEIYIPIRG